MLIRPAIYSDLPALRGLAETFVRESGHGYTFDRANTDTAFASYIATGGAWLAFSDRPLGFWTAFIAHEYVVEPLCYVNKFYVAPWGRGQGVASALMQSLIEWAGCEIWVTATASIGDDDGFIRLCEHRGFRRGGWAMVR